MAKHLIDGLEERGIERVFLRTNTKDGSAKLIAIKIDSWRFHPTDSTVDVAAVRLVLSNEFDFMQVPITMAATPDIVLENAIGIGDEVFIAGLFHKHSGTLRNIPIIRVGSIAAIREERIPTKRFGLIDAYLIEARSIGGISGSPVFAYCGHERIVNRQLITPRGTFWLLGLIHGHFDIKQSLVDYLTKIVPSKNER